MFPSPPQPLMEAIAQGVLVHEDGRVLACDDRAVRLLGYDRQDLLIHVDIFDLVAAEDRAAVRERAASGLSGAYLTTLLRRDGTALRAEVSITQLDIDGRRLRLCGIRDLSAQDDLDRRLRAAVVEAERRLEQTARLDAVMRSVHDAIVTIDETGCVLDVNPALTRLLGHAREDVVGRDVACLMPEPYASRHGGFLAAYARTGRATILGGKREVPALRKDGTIVPVELAVNVAEVAGRRLFIGLMSDLTARKEAEVALLRATEEAVAANQAKSRFLAHMSHELRTPLNAILGFSELMEQEMLGPLGNPAYLDYAGHIRGSAGALFSTLETILEMASLGSRRFDPAELCEMGCAVAVQEALRTLAHRIAGGAVDVDVAGLDPDVRLRANPPAFQRVLVGLLDNAIKFTPAGGRITLSCAVEAGACVVTVADTGCGMDDAMIAEVCRPFLPHGSPLVADQRRGIGLGLTLARELVALHGGRLEIDSQPGRGTAVRCILPGADRAAQARESERVASA